MARVEIGYFTALTSDDRRLKLLLRCIVGDKNFWYDPETKSYTICLDEDTILLLLESYMAINGYNIWKRRKRFLAKDYN